jgi:hypothetical protein
VIAAQIVAVIGGVLIVIVAVTDAVGALLVTQARPARWRPSRILYAYTWRPWRAMAARFGDGAAGERALALYGPMTLVALLVVWLALLMAGWSLVYLGVSALSDVGPRDYADLVYFSGTSLFAGTLGVVAPSAIVRWLSLIETLTGLGTLALLVAYLPSLYGAYNRREARLLSLDDGAGRRITPLALVTMNAPDGDLGRLCDFFAGWELWTAELIENNTAYPALMYFRSRHAGLSWLTALGLVLDGATLACAAIPGAEQREPNTMFQRGRHALNEFAARLHAEPAPDREPPSRERLRVAYSRLVATTIPARDFEYTWRRLQSLRLEYAPNLEGLIEFLRVPRDLWGHAAENAEEPIRSHNRFTNVPPHRPEMSEYPRPGP